MRNRSTLNLFNDQAGYAARFMDVAVWEPHIHMVCNHHSFICEGIEPGVPGTFPTFMVETSGENAERSSKKIVVKFFGPLFEGASSFTIERDMGKWLEAHPLPIASPGVLAEGQLDQDWQYLIFEHVLGVSIDQARERLSPNDWLSIATQMGEYLQCLHTLTYRHLSELPQSIRPGTEKFTRFLKHQLAYCQSNHRKWNELPAQLADQIDNFVLPIEQLVDFSTQPHLIHADLTVDHLLGSLQNKGWQTSSVIDWGDMMAGNLLYELVALHLDLFHTDRNLLRACLETYGLPAFYQRDFPRKALSMALLHQFPMPPRVYAPFLQVQSLQELAECLFAI